MVIIIIVFQEMFLFIFLVVVLSIKLSKIVLFSVKHYYSTLSEILPMSIHYVSMKK